MFIPLIAAIIVILAIMAYMSSSSTVVDTTVVKMKYEKVKYAYQIENVLKDSIENYCQANSATCKSKISGGEIILNLSDLNGYIPSNFVNDNLNGGVFTGIKITNNFSTIRLTETIPDDTIRHIYLFNYNGRAFGVPPKCVSGSEGDTVPCSTEEVYHDYPTSLNTRAALQ